METGRYRGRLAWLLSFLIHGGIVALFYPHALGVDRLIAAAVDIDALGLRGGVRWAEAIGLTEAGGESGRLNKARQTPGEALRVELIEQLPSRGSDILSQRQTEDDSSNRRADHQAELEGKRRAKNQNAETAPANPAAPAQAASDAKKGRALAEKIGKDIDGAAAGMGGADNIAEGSFVSGAETKRMLSGWTLIGTNGFADGSISAGREEVRRKITWQVYYRSDGYLYARFLKSAALTPHGAIGLRQFYSGGRWWVKGHWLCQSIHRWFYGGEVCFEVRRKGAKQIALYYASCWGVARSR